MARTNFESLRVYRLAESLADQIWSIVVKWNVFARDTVGKQLVRAVDSIGANIAEGTRVGSGQKTKGGFCSLDCYARFYEVEIIQRTYRLAELSRRNQDS